MRCINPEATGQNIVNLAKAQGHNIKAMADQLECNIQAIYKWSHGVCLPSVDHLVDLSDWLGVSLEELLVIEER